MKTNLTRREFAAATASAFAGIVIPSKPAEAATFRWKWSFDLGAEHPIAVRMVEAFGKIRRETKGQVDIKAFPMNVLGGISNVLAQTRSGAIEMSMQPGAVFDSIVTIAAIENLAYAYPTRKTVFDALDGDIGAAIRQQSLERGMFLLERIFENGWRDFTSSKAPIRSVADLEGLRLRVSPGKIRFDTFRSLGAAVTTVASNELYTALQTHIVDAMESSIGVIESLRTYEVQKYLSRSHHMWSGYWTMINPAKWNSLGSTFQEIVRRNINEAALLERNDNEIQDRALQDLLHRQGLEVNFPQSDSFKAKLASNGYYGRWRSEFGEPVWVMLEKHVGPLR